MHCPKCGTEFRISVVFGEQTVGKVKRVSSMSDEQRKAAGVRLQTARASKYGLSLEQYRELHLAPVTFYLRIEFDHRTRWATNGHGLIKVLPSDVHVVELRFLRR